MMRAKYQKPQSQKETDTDEQGTSSSALDQRQETQKEEELEHFQHCFDEGLKE